MMIIICQYDNHHNMTDWCPMIWWYRCKFPSSTWTLAKGPQSGHHTNAAHMVKDKKLTFANIYEQSIIFAQISPFFKLRASIRATYIDGLHILIFPGYVLLHSKKYLQIQPMPILQPTGYIDLIPDMLRFIYKSLQVWIFRQKLQGFPIISQKCFPIFKTFSSLQALLDANKSFALITFHKTIWLSDKTIWASDKTIWPSDKNIWLSDNFCSSVFLAALVAMYRPLVRGEDKDQFQTLLDQIVSLVYPHIKNSKEFFFRAFSHFCKIFLCQVKSFQKVSVW